ncbi:hypothetical protein [Chitinophaga sp. 212800010-3]|uniref:glycosyl hydrolase family protein n=1 Tax=unclassified Chitinophaga TaxID=2619133 RepID=UPI002DEEDFBB|nr:Glyco-hydro-79C domain-containing protein [Chitinophaga sp. 212800010-3]
MQKSAFSYILLLPLLWLLSASCRKSTTSIIVPPPLTGTPVNITLHPDQPGSAIPATFTGFSYETGAVTDSNFLTPSNSVLIRLIQNLGKGYLRIGGNSSDNLVWTGAPRNNNTGKDSLTTTDVNRLSAFINATGWPVIFGLNMGVFDINRAAAEVNYLNNQTGAHISYWQSGNEPDLFSRNGHRPATYQYGDYQLQWELYYKAVKTVCPSCAFAGPDVAYNTKWVANFSAAESQHISLLDGHYYRTGPASDSNITYKTILAADTKLPGYLDALNNSAKAHQLTYRISECNSVYSGGRKGVSDVFAAALWTLDFMWTAAGHNCQGVNFHGGQGGAYTPIAMTNGVPVARPEYYALLAFHSGAVGNLIPADVNTGQLNASVYACKDGGTEYVTLINKEEQQSIAITIQPGMKAQSAQVLPLSAPGLTSSSGVTFAGSQPDATGNFTPGPGTSYTPSNGNFVINIPAGSAAVVIIR